MSADTSVPKQREAGLDDFGSWLPNAVLRDAPAGVAFLGTDMRFVWVNPALAAMFGRDGADFAGQSLAEAWPAVESARAEAALQRVLDDGHPATETFAAGSAANDLPSSRTFHWFPVHGPDGELSGAGLIVVAGGFGLPTEEFLGSGWLDSIHPEYRERVERDWRECLRTGRIFDDRFRMRTRSGAYRHYDVRAVPIERDGKIAEWVGACTDVTSQREAEEMRGRLTEQLSAAALRTARLQQATSMLAEALDVEQVVEVITEVGRTAIGALRSAVALLDEEKLRLRVVNPEGLAPDGPDSADARLTLDTPSVMTRAIATRRPVLIPSPEELRRQFEPDLAEGAESGAIEETGDERSWVGLPLLAAGEPLGAVRFSLK